MIDPEVGKLTDIGVGTGLKHQGSQWGVLTGLNLLCLGTGVINDSYILLFG